MSVNVLLIFKVLFGGLIGITKFINNFPLSHSVLASMLLFCAHFQSDYWL